MFSVIVPLYNKAAYVEKAVQSIINQTFKEFELIIIDDGSTDNSLQVVKKLRTANHEFRIIEQQNSGVSTARNNGVKLAKYDYIAFLDADDWWAPTFLEEMKDLINEFPEEALYATFYYKVKNHKNTVAKIGVPDGFKKGYFDYINAYTVSPWMPVCIGAVVLSKEVFNEMHGFKPQLKLGEDFDLWIRIALKYKVVLLNKPLIYYNQDVEQANRAIGQKLHKPE
ncbi:MAG: glycosyltransferase, partial [Prevotellaceae bacterium]|nr:glycosyltransferase [Prevotellaceae bacterium]